MSDVPNEPILPETATANDAIRYVRALVRWIGPGFHPDEDFHGYVNLDTDRPLFESDQATRLNRELDRAVALLDAVGVDPCYVGVRVQHRLLREMGYAPAFQGMR